MTSDLIRRNIWWAAKNKNLDFSMIRSSKIAILKVVDRAENMLSARINDRQKSGDRKILAFCMHVDNKIRIQNLPEAMFAQGTYCLHSNDCPSQFCGHDRDEERNRCRAHKKVRSLRRPLESIHHLIS